MPFQLFLLINIWANFWKNSTDRGVNKSSKIRRTCFVSSNFFSIRMWVFSRWRMDKIWRQNSCLIFNVVPHLNFWSLPFWSIHRWEGKVAYLFLMNPRRFKYRAWDLGKPMIPHYFGLFSLKPQGTAEEARLKKSRDSFDNEPLPTSAIDLHSNDSTVASCPKWLLTALVVLTTWKFLGLQVVRTQHCRTFFSTPWCDVVNVC